MRVGSIVYATEQGLGYLAKSFYDAGVVTDVLVLQHGSRPSYLEWFDRGRIIGREGLLGREARLFCTSMDVMLFFETPFDWSLMKHCREQGVKTALMPMYECHPKCPSFAPDLYICPSLLDLDYFPTNCLNGGPPYHGNKSVYLPVPVEDFWAKHYRQRTEARVFVHNGGNGGLRGRNGTAEVLAAAKLIGSPAKIIIRRQAGQPFKEVSGNVHITDGNCPRELLYEEGDVFLFPDKFNGLSLPLQEAHACGMMVMSTNRYPANTWLPRKPLIRLSRFQKAQVSSGCMEFHEAIVKPEDIAEAIDYWYGKDISEYSISGKQWAAENSWEVLRPRYLKVLEQLWGR